jgi:Zn-dependent alcohol dehydrogenase
MGTLARVVVLPMGSKELQIQQLELPEPGPNQVEVRQFASGICHSQLHEINRDRTNNLLLGHESTGEVTKVGAEVTHVVPGDIVMITWVSRNPDTVSAPPQTFRMPINDGTAWTKSVFTWADVTLADEQFVVKVNPDITRDVTSIIGCAVMTGAGAVINTADVQPGESVAIFGVGGVGLSAVAGARMAGAHPIIAVDLNDDKLQLARNFGATHLINASREDPVESIHFLTAQQGKFTFQQATVSGADYTFDCIGINSTMKQTIAACRKGQFGARTGGAAIFVGLPTDRLDINVMELLVTERSLIGSFCGSCTPDVDIPRFISWYENGDLNLDALVTERFRLEQINEAVTALGAGKIQGRAIIEF